MKWGKFNQRFKGLVNGIGAMLGFFGLAGISESITGHGSFMVSTIVFAIGLGICLWDLVEGREEK